MKAFFFVFLAGLSLVFYQNCAPYESAGDVSSSSVPLDDQLSIDAYKLSLAPVLTGTGSCVDCHGIGQIPLFAVFSNSLAHNSLISNNLVDFNNPASSRLVIKINGGHQGYPASKATEIEAAIQDWATRLSL